MPAATVMAPSAPMLRPAFGLVPGVRLTLVPMTAATPLVVSLPITLPVVPPLPPLMAANVVSSSAFMEGFTVTLTVAVSHTIWFGLARQTW